MSGCLALYPLALSAAAVIGHTSGFYRVVKSLFIHICHHKDFICLMILYNDRDESVRIQFELREVQYTLERCHLNSCISTDFLKFVEIHVQAADEKTGYTFDAVAF